MAFPASDLPDPATWFSNALVTAALMKSNYTDAINLLPRGRLYSGNSSTAVTLSATSAFAGNGGGSLVLNQQRAVKVIVKARFKGTSGGRYQIQAGYNTGTSAAIGSFVALDPLPSDVGADANSTWNTQYSIGSGVLAAGTYFFYASLLRFAGAATDTVDNFVVLVEDVGAS